MKNIFKLMGVALMACTLLVACNKDNDENDTTPQEPTGPVVIKWGGEYQTIGFTDAYYGYPATTIHVLDAAKGVDGENYVFPLFRFGFDLDTDPQYGCTLSAHWAYGEQRINGNNLAPTEVFDSVAINGNRGDWQIVEDADFVAGYQFDGNSHTFTGEITVKMFSWLDYQAVGNFEQGIADGSIRTRDLNLKMNAVTFEAYEQK